MTPVEIVSLETPELELYASLRENTEHWRGGVFVAEGEKVVRRLMESGWGIVSMLLSREWYRALEEQLSEERYAGVKVFLADETLLERIVGYKLHKNIMAIGRIPASPALESLGPRAGGSNVHAAVEAIADAENMGAIMRNCAAFGIDTLIVGSDSSSPYLRRSVRVSMGTVFSLRILQTDNLLETLAGLRSMHRWRIAGTTPRGGTNRFSPPSAEHPLCVLFGSEAHGLTPEALELCDEVFTIPMKNGCDSINVANSVAVALYEAVRGE